MKARSVVAGLAVAGGIAMASTAPAFAAGGKLPPPTVAGEITSVMFFDNTCAQGGDQWDPMSYHTTQGGMWYVPPAAKSFRIDTAPVGRHNALMPCFDLRSKTAPIDVAVPATAPAPAWKVAAVIALTIVAYAVSVVGGVAFVLRRRGKRQ